MNTTLPKRPPARPVLDKRTGLIDSGWKTFASATLSGGFSSAAYSAKRQSVFDLRTQLANAEQLVKQLRHQVQTAELDLWGTSGLVVRGVAGDPAFGPNSALDGSFGLVRTSARQSGLTRKTSGPLTREELATPQKQLVLPTLKPLAVGALNGNGNGNGEH